MVPFDRSHKFVIKQTYQRGPAGRTNEVNTSSNNSESTKETIKDQKTTEPAVADEKTTASAESDKVTEPAATDEKTTASAESDEKA